MSKYNPKAQGETKWKVSLREVKIERCNTSIKILTGPEEINGSKTLVVLVSENKGKQMASKTEKCVILKKDWSKVKFFLTSCVTRLCHRQQLKTRRQVCKIQTQCRKNLQNPHNTDGRIKHANSKIKTSFRVTSISIKNRMIPCVLG